MSGEEEEETFTSLGLARRKSCRLKSQEKTLKVLFLDMAFKVEELRKVLAVQKEGGPMLFF